ncbi:MAG: phosphoglucosamine mutase [Saprospiraceae bacterium]|nr:phosphoglucosamine mutase [Saprospiraceae bacterium]MBK9632845.1 phosphoglucosamine mutase [Saprospiraceae bacterium]
MSLIASVSGIRGTIGGRPKDNLTPKDIMDFTLAYGYLLKSKFDKPCIALGRDARLSGAMVSSIVEGTLSSIGIDILNLGLTTTPTIEMAVISNKLNGGVMITASHNPEEWNALKLFNEKGEFISAEEGQKIKELIQKEIISQQFVGVRDLGKLQVDRSSAQEHIDAILSLPYLPIEQIKASKMRIVVDCINSTGAIILPVLLEALNCEYHLINSEPTGIFAHNPEPLEIHLTDLMKACEEFKADLGIAVDPDVDRLAFVDEKGNYFGEEYTLVACADYLLDVKLGPVVTNLSSSRALADLAQSKGQQCHFSAVGEVHVVRKMKETHAVIGGEGNGGVILPDLHYGRDALIGIVLVMANLVKKKLSLSALKESYSKYFMNKDKIILPEKVDYESLISFLMNKYRDQKLNIEDGLKIDFESSWVHLRKSNTEPIIRIYAEAKDINSAQKLVDQIKQDVNSFLT